MPMMIFGTASLVAGALAMFLPETKGKPLPENTEEALNLSNGISICHVKRILKPCSNGIVREEDGITTAEVNETTKLLVDVNERTRLLDNCSVCHKRRRRHHQCGRE